MHSLTDGGWRYRLHPVRATERMNRTRHGASNEGTTDDDHAHRRPRRRCVRRLYQQQQPRTGRQDHDCHRAARRTDDNHLLGWDQATLQVTGRGDPGSIRRARARCRVTRVAAGSIGFASLLMEFSKDGS